MYLKRLLSPKLITFKGKHFGYKTKKKKNHRYRVTIGIGGNIGDVKRRFEHLFVELRRDRRVELVQTSLILQNPPFGFIDQDDFLNSIVVLYVNMQPHTFLDYLMRLEKKFSRKRSFANAPRTLDLDIIFFDNRTIQTKRLIIPHAYYRERDSVMIPLRELAK